MYILESRGPSHFQLLLIKQQQQQQLHAICWSCHTQRKCYKHTHTNMHVHEGSAAICCGLAHFCAVLFFGVKNLWFKDTKIKFN